MSQALEYLVKARPEAMGAYFKFLKEAGTHLDPKTRDLISVITKVAVQTERGFRQYLSRALRDGCTPNEIIDALLMAFPALGLAKIIWAMDILLEMNIPEFELEHLNEQPQWRDVAAVADIPDGKAQYLPVDDRHVFVYRQGDAFRVYDSHCPHQVTDIPELALEGLSLTCPKHEWSFDITTGACTAKGTKPLRSLECRVGNGRLEAFF